MYIIKRGKLAVVSDDGKTTFVVLNEGSVFGEISILNIPGEKKRTDFAPVEQKNWIGVWFSRWGSKNGNRRTANVKSLGYSDLYTLSKDDLWQVLDNYPESLAKIVEKGKSILRKDNLLDESLADSKRYVEQDQLMSIQKRLKKLNEIDHSVNERMSQFFEEYVNSIRKFKQRLSKVEYRHGARKNSVAPAPSVPLSAPAVPFLLNQWKQNTAATFKKFQSSPSMQIDDEWTLNERDLSFSRFA